MDEITLYQWWALGFLALIAVLIWRVLLAVEAVEKNTLQDNGSPAPSERNPGTGHGQRIRLHGIDAPESRQLCRQDGLAGTVVPHRKTCGN